MKKGYLVNYYDLIEACLIASEMEIKYSFLRLVTLEKSNHKRAVIHYYKHDRIEVWTGLERLRCKEFNNSEELAEYLVKNDYTFYRPMDINEVMYKLISEEDK
jgi:hypothetical protein